MIRKPVSFVVLFAAVVAAAALGVAAWGPAPEPGPGPDPDPVAFSAFGNNGGFTDLADELNGLIMNSYVACGADAYGEGAYNCGSNTGVMIRIPDFIKGTGTAVVPASIIHNDIAAPNVVYPAVGDPWCENCEFSPIRELRPPPSLWSELRTCLTRCEIRCPSSFSFG